MTPERIRTVAHEAVERKNGKESDVDPYENHDEQDGRWLGWVLLLMGLAIISGAAWLAWGWWG